PTSRKTKVVLSKLLLITARNSEALEKLLKNHKKIINLIFINNLIFITFYYRDRFQLKKDFNLFKKRTNRRLN
ncbi:hypothetical protein, partial [Vibrio crassostreae]|uniref:hypothetical protein n=2 Tax=Vibrio crassostreae TaxID=246167 RepID=UPI001B30AE38